MISAYLNFFLFALLKAGPLDTIDSNFVAEHPYNASELIQKGCDGVCVSVSMDLPVNSSWTSQTGVNNWYQSFGSPTVSPNSAWMWSYNSKGEGV